MLYNSMHGHKGAGKREELQKPRPVWAGQNRQFWHYGHIYGELRGEVLSAGMFAKHIINWVCMDRLLEGMFELNKTAVEILGGNMTIRHWGVCVCARPYV